MLFSQNNLDVVLGTSVAAQPKTGPAHEEPMSNAKFGLMYSQAGQFDRPAAEGYYRFGKDFQPTQFDNLHHEEIAQQQNTSLVVVAPGIAEALLATGLGLMAAIPAVVFYNKLSADSDRIIAGYESFADEFSTILSRQLDS